MSPVDEVCSANLGSNLESVYSNIEALLNLELPDITANKLADDKMVSLLGFAESSRLTF